MTRKAWAISVLLSLFFSPELKAQTCCSGGVPISGNLGLPAGPAGELLLSLNYDYNFLNTLLDSTSVLNDISRTRTTHSLLLEVGYQISARWSVSLLATGVRQERILHPIGFPMRHQSTSGIGDAVLLLRYQPWQFLMLGLGTKVPLGAFDIMDNRGIQLNADLQPGSGAWDAILWVQSTIPWSVSPSGAWSVTAISRLTGVNPAFRTGQSYQFGNDIQAIIGYTDRIFLLNQVLDLSGMVRYRWADMDKTNGGEIPNTGGNWLFVNPGMAWWPTPELSFQVNGEVPIYQVVAGVQLSPTWRINTGVYFQISTKKKNEGLEF